VSIPALSNLQRQAAFGLTPDWTGRLALHGLVTKPDMRHISLALMVFGCAGDGSKTADSASPDSAAEPVDWVSTLGTRGPFSVGYAVEDLVYAQPDGLGDRELRLCWWFPADAEGVVPAKYLLNSIEAPGVWADVVAAAGPHPVVVFSHGHQGFAENSAFLLEHFASHGWVVAAPDHTNNTTFDGGDRDTEIYLQRPWDISAVLDHIEGLPGGHALEGRADTSTVLASGHSFGGYTLMALAGAQHDMDTWSAACADGDAAPFCSTMTPQLESLLRGGFHEPRIHGYLPMAGGDFDKFGVSGLGVVEASIVQLDGGFDSPEERTAVWEAVSGPGDLRVTLDTAGHQSFTDFAGTLGDQELEGLVDAAEGWRVIEVYGMAFGESLRGTGGLASILDGTAPVGEQVTLNHGS
jgi:predicted dienelactone hydrolase